MKHVLAIGEFEPNNDDYARSVNFRDNSFVIFN